MLALVSKTRALEDLATEVMNEKKSIFVKKIHILQQIKCFFNWSKKPGMLKRQYNTNQTKTKD